jgi:hypothetical protein
VVLSDDDPAINGRAILNDVWMLDPALKRRAIFKNKPGGLPCSLRQADRAFENSPAIYGWVNRPTKTRQVPSGTKEIAL